MAPITDPERIRQLRLKAIEHMEIALACLDETRDQTVGYPVEQALIELRRRAYPPDPFSRKERR